jgi:ferredoxin
VTDDLLEAAERGAAACPERAITIRSGVSSSTEKG